jgi:membrane protease YdiL (CAAX protease family)
MPPSTASSRNLLTSLILVFPLLLIYQLGVLLTLPMLNGTDFVTVFLLSYLGLSVSQYLMFVAAVMLLFVAALVVLKRHEHFQPRMILPVLLESTIYALTMGSLIVLVMTKLLGIPPQLSGVLAQQGLVSRFVMSLGAGVYEELVFRLGLLGGLVVFTQRVLGWGRWLSVTAAFLVSSIAFSAVHHIPPYGDPFSLDAFTFRVLAGIFFGVLFWFRGLAVAVYTHAFYDLYVLLVR